MWFGSLAIRSLPAVLVLLLLNGAADRLQGQVLKGQILGTISDTSSAIVPSAEVTLTEVRTNVTRRAASNESGLYVFPNLDPGDYQVEVESQGFSRAVRTGILLQPNTTARVNIELQPAW
jgi:hypothetical protein